MYSRLTFFLSIVGGDYYSQGTRPESRATTANDYADYYARHGYNYDAYAYQDAYGYDPYNYGYGYQGYDQYNQGTYDVPLLSPFSFVIISTMTFHFSPPF